MMKKQGLLFVIMAASLICGCGDMYSTGVQQLKPSALTYATTSAIYIKDFAIQENVPSVTGEVSSWSVSPSLPDGLNLDPSTGIISGTPTTDQDPVEYTVTAENGYGSATVIVSIAVNEMPPMALAYGTTSAVYTQNLAIAENAPTVTGTVTAWSVSPPLPAGLSLDPSTGIISGTPTTAQSAIEYIVTARNPYGTATVNLSIAIDLVAPSGLSYSTPAAVYTQFATIIKNTPTVTGTVTSWTITPDLPAGLTLDSSTGNISGTPTAGQTATVHTVTAVNAVGSTMAAVTVTVGLVPPMNLAYAASSAVYTQNMVIVDNTPMVTGTAESWSVNPTLPTGLTLNTTTGVISGMPIHSQPETTYAVTAKNSVGETSVNIKIAVSMVAPRDISYSANPAAYYRNRVIVNNTPTVTGTVGVWSISPALPAGLTLNTTTGAISGTPTGTRGLSNYTITATNAAGSTTAVISIVVMLPGGTCATALNIGGIVTTLAGSTGSGSADGTGSAAGFCSPGGITTDGVHLYVADSSNHTIRTIAISTGAVTTLAGTAGTPGSADGTGAAGLFNIPNGITTDGTYLYVADSKNHAIRTIAISTGAVTTLAGLAGTSGTSNGTGTSARFNYPYSITTDGTSLYVADTYNHAIRKIVIASAVVTTLAGTIGNYGNSDGNGTSASFYHPEGITTDGSRLFIADSLNHVIRKIVIASAEVTTLAGMGCQGSADGTGEYASFRIPRDLTTDGTYLYVTDSSNHEIRKIMISSGAVTTLAGSTTSGSADGAGSAAGFYYPGQITTDGTRLFTADRSNHEIRIIQ